MFISQLAISAPSAAQLIPIPVPTPPAAMVIFVFLILAYGEFDNIPTTVPAEGTLILISQSEINWIFPETAKTLKPPFNSIFELKTAELDMPLPK